MNIVSRVVQIVQYFSSKSGASRLSGRKFRSQKYISKPSTYLDL